MKDLKRLLCFSLTGSVLLLSLTVSAGPEVYADELWIDPLSSEGMATLSFDNIVDSEGGAALAPPCICTVLKSTQSSDVVPESSVVLNTSRPLVDAKGKQTDTVYKLRDSSGCDNAGNGGVCTLIACKGKLDLAVGRKDQTVEVYGTCRAIAF